MVSSRSYQCEDPIPSFSTAAVSFTGFFRIQPRSCYIPSKTRVVDDAEVNHDARAHKKRQHDDQGVNQNVCAVSAIFSILRGTH